jgi:glutathione S-transferase
MKLYYSPGAPSPGKVTLFLAEKRVELPTVHVDLRQRAQQQPEFMAKNPSATVPVLELDDGTCLTESLAICVYVESLYPEPNLFGRDAKERSLVLMWNDIETFEGYLAVQEVLRNAHPAFAGRALPGTHEYEQIPALVERGRRRAARFFDRLDERLAESPFVAGDRFTYADIAGFVYTTFAERALQEHPASSRPALKRWFDGIAGRPSFAAAR